ncbi:MAG: acyl-CoA/acyl-ACP dehydrogenase [Deltaproteobacteria bacterium]|nr:acyl-CoA/acyl-ACP dehydrogenase [Deltaproteobacteria bacterium]
MGTDLDRLFFREDAADDAAKGVLNVVRQWAEREVISRRQEYREHYETLFREKRKNLELDIGLQRLTLPENRGGFGWDGTTDCPRVTSVLLETGKADAAEGFMLAVTYVFLALLTRVPAQSERALSSFAPRYGGEGLQTTALVLPAAGFSDVETPLFGGRAMTAVLETAGNATSLTGRNLRPCACGAIADSFGIAAADKEGRAVWAVIIDGEGVQRGPEVRTTGLSACRNAEITLERISVPEGFILDREGILEETYTFLNAYLGAVSLGAAMDFFEILNDWSENRVIKGGTPMKNDQLCASVLADVAMEILLGRILLSELTGIMAAPEQWEGDRLEKLFTYGQIIGSRVQSAALRAMNRGMELMGSAGYAREWHAEKHWRDIKTIQSIVAGVGADVPVKMQAARFFYGSRGV